MAKILSEKAKKISGMFLSYVLHTNQRRCFYWLESMGFSNCIDLPSQLQKKEMAEYLIENGANGNSTCSNLKTLLHFAWILNHEDFCNFASLKWCIFECEGSRHKNSYWRMFDEETIDCLQNNAFVWSILK